MIQVSPVLLQFCSSLLQSENSRLLQFCSSLLQSENSRLLQFCSSSAPVCSSQTNTRKSLYFNKKRAFMALSKLLDGLLRQGLVRMNVSGYRGWLPCRGPPVAYANRLVKPMRITGAELT